MNTSNHHISSKKTKDENNKTGNAVSSTFSPTFHFEHLKIGNLENASAINFGNNYPTNFKGYKKHNQGLGTIDGDHNNIHDLEAYMNQNYLLDTIIDKDEDLPIWIKELIKDHQNKEERVHKDINNEQAYQKVRSLLGIEQVPMFFKRLGRKESVLDKVVEAINEQWNSSFNFNAFYYEVLIRLNEISIPSSTYNLKLDEDLFREIADNIEEKSKVLLVLILLVEELLPNYLQTNNIKKIRFYKNKLGLETKELEIGQLINLLKESLNLEEMPPSFKRLRELPKTFQFMFFRVIEPLINNNPVDQYLTSMKELFIRESKQIKRGHFKLELTVGEKSFLFTKLLNNLEDYPKMLFLEYVFLSLYSPPNNY